MSGCCITCKQRSFCPNINASCSGYKILCRNGINWLTVYIFESRSCRGYSWISDSTWGSICFICGELSWTTNNIGTICVWGIIKGSRTFCGVLNPSFFGKPCGSVGGGVGRCIIKEMEFNFIIPDDEIAFLAMHIGLIISSETKQTNNVNILCYIQLVLLGITWNNLGQVQNLLVYHKLLQECACCPFLFY